MADRLARLWDHLATHSAVIPTESIALLVWAQTSFN